jgi:hypothetical protein
MRTAQQLSLPFERGIERDGVSVVQQGRPGTDLLLASRSLDPNKSKSHKY